MLDNLNYLRHHNNTFNNFFNIIGCGLKLNSSIVVLNELGLAWNFKCLNFSLIDNNLSENFFRNLFFNKVFRFVNDFFNDFLDNFNLFLMMNFFFDFLYLINKCSNSNISVGLDFNWNFLVMNIMLWSVNFDKIRLLYDFGYVNRERPFMIFMYNLVHIEIDFFGYLYSVLDLNDLLSQNLDFFRNLNILDSFRTKNLFNNLNFNSLLNLHLDYFRDSNSLCDRSFFLYNLRYFNNVLDYFFCNDRFLDDKFHRNFMSERNHDLPVLDSDLMNLN